MFITSDFLDKSKMGSVLSVIELMGAMNVLTIEQIVNLT